MFGNIETKGVEKAEDRLGGFKIWDTDIYEFEIKTAYGGASDGGAKFVSFVLVHPTGEYNETVYVTNKKNEVFWEDKNDGGKKKPLPGYALVNDICMLLLGQTLAEAGAEMEEKTVKIFDYDAKKQLPKSVPCITALHGQKIALAIEAVRENKNVKEGNVYVPSAEIITKNVIAKAFHPEYKATVNEAEESKDPEFWDKWLEKNKGKVRDNLKYKGNATAGGPPQAAGRPTKTTEAPSATAPARKSLFAKKS